MDALSGTSWILAALIGTSVHAGGGTISMEFEEGRLRGSDGCNRYVSSYVSTGEQLKIDPNIAATKMACVRTAMQRAFAFTEALKKAARYRRQGEQLELLDAGGETLAVFQSGRL